MTENKARCAPVAMATEIFKYNFYLPLTLHAETLEGDIQALSRHLAYRKKKNPRLVTGLHGASSPQGKHLSGACDKKAQDHQRGHTGKARKLLTELKDHCCPGLL